MFSSQQSECAVTHLIVEQLHFHLTLCIKDLNVQTHGCDNAGTCCRLL